jgi:coenzyme F420-0:L-glutamate ligase/coenzyme F420-1:gamma-L-glutamate ligase
MSHRPGGFSVVPLPGIPLVEDGDNLAALITDALAAANIAPAAGDIFVVAQKIISKAEGRQIPLSDVTPTPEAEALARETEKDPRLVQLILDESTLVLRKKPGVLIVRHRSGIVGANAGIDQSNVDHENGEVALLLPVDADASAANLRTALEGRFGVHLGVIVSDSMNRPWRLGTLASAIGASGVASLDDHRGGEDLFGRELKVMGETTERIPVALVRGLPPDEAEQSASEMIRPLDEDLFQ